MGYGAASGAWESAQWFVGGNISKVAPTASKVANSAIRIAINTGFNAADTPYRALVDSTFTKNKTYKKAFEEQGGWTSVITNVAIGLVGSVLEEAVDYKKTRNETKNEKLKNNTSINKDELDLKKKIQVKAKKIDDEALKAKAIYDELNKNVHYDFAYSTGDNATKQTIINTEINFEKMKDNKKVICKGWSELYCEALQSEGINAKVVKAKNDNHWWVEVNLKNGETIVADATDAMHGKLIDLTNSKTGMPTSGFFFIDESQRGIRPKDIAVEKTIRDRLYEMDKKLGYANESGYKLEQMAKAKKLFKSSIFDQNNQMNYYDAEKTLKILKKLDIPAGMDGLELYGYYKSISNISQGSVAIYPKAYIRGSGSNAEFICAVLEKTEKKGFYQLYGEFMGKKQFKSKIELENFLKLNNIREFR